LSYLETPEAKKADPLNGKSVFAKAQCAKCHRHGETGEGIGPELSSVSRRFQNKEILESILYPSLVISDQYSSKEIETKNGRVINGMVADQPDGSIVVLMSNGEKVTLEKSEIEKTSPSRTSAMPKGLLNALTLEEIGELFAFLQQQPKSNLTSRRPPTATK
jgi:putative heme-binding domain-containing protein